MRGACIVQTNGLAPSKIPTCVAKPEHGFGWAAQTSTSKLVAGTEDTNKLPDYGDDYGPAQMKVTDGRTPPARQDNRRVMNLPAA
jgi:hypothetical protein